MTTSSQGVLATSDALPQAKLVGADDDFTALKWTEIAPLDFRVIRLCLKNLAGQEELFRHLLKPLLAKIRWCDDQNATFSFCPLLREDKSGLYGFS